MPVAARQDVVVGGRHEPARRVVRHRERIERQEAVPLILARARDRQGAGPVALRHQAGGHPADVPIDVGIHQVLGGQQPFGRRRPEGAPVAGAVERERGHVPRRPGLRAHEAKRKGPVPRGILTNQWPMFRELSHQHTRRLAGYAQRVDLAPQRLPAAAIEVASHLRRRRACGTRPDRFHVDVLLVHADDGEAERHAVVVAGRDPGNARLARANDIPARPHQVREVPQRRVLHGPMRIVGQQWLARCRLGATHHPVV